MKNTDVIDVGDDVVMMLATPSGTQAPAMKVIQAWEDTVTHERWVKCYFFTTSGEIQDRDFPTRVLRKVPPNPTRLDHELLLGRVMLSFLAEAHRQDRNKAIQTVVRLVSSVDNLDPLADLFQELGMPEFAQDLRGKHGLAE